MGNELRGASIQEGSEKEVSGCASKTAEGGSAISNGRASNEALSGDMSDRHPGFGGTYPVRNYRLSPKDVKIVIDLLSSSTTTRARAVDYGRIALSLQKQLDGWIKHFIECENAANDDTLTPGI